MISKSSIINFSAIFFLLTLFIFAQNKTDKEKVNSNFSKSESINSVTATGDEVNIKNSTGNAIITFTDEGSNAGSMTLPQAVLSTPTTNKLYNVGGSLYFNGSALGTAGSAGGWTHSGTSIYQSTLSDNVGLGTAAPKSILQIISKNNWDPSVGLGWGDFSIGNATVGLSIGVATAGSGTGDVRLWTQGGTERLIFSSVTDGDNMSISNGKVGIGTLDPSQNLDIRGSTTDADAILSLGNSDLSHQLTIFPGRSTDPNAFIRWKKGDPLRFAVDPGAPLFFNELMRIESNGNVGIGTTTPSAKLEISGQVKITGGVPGVGKVLTSDANGLANWQTVSTGAAQIDDLSDAISDGSSVFLGAGAGSNDDRTSHKNSAVGLNALFSNSTGFSNTANGAEALYSNTSGQANTATGLAALRTNNGDFNTATGLSALYSNTGGDGNTANGYQALYSNSTGLYNVANGYRALYLNDGGYENTANGYRALYSNVNGFLNTAIGSNALYSTKAGNNAVAIGYQSQYYANNTTTAYTNNNTSVGYQSLMGTTTAANNTGTKNSAFGYQALKTDKTGFSNSAFGYLALSSNQIGTDNTAVGQSALQASNSYENTAVGSNSMHDNDSGQQNSAFGVSSLYSNISGSFNTALGYNALAGNTSGSGNVAIGHFAGTSETGSNKLYIANDGRTNPLIYGDFSTNDLRVNGNLTVTGTFSNPSDRRLKKDIKPLKNALEKIKMINGVTFNWKEQYVEKGVYSSGLQIGVIAQELEKVFPELVVTDEKGFKSVQYLKLTAVLVEAVKEQNSEFRNQNIELKERIEKLERENEKIRIQNAEVRTQNEKLKVVENEINVIKAALNKLVTEQEHVKVSSK